MVNRRHIRIKVMQSVYAVLQSKNEDLQKEESFLKLSINKAINLYVLQLLLLVEVKKIAREHIEIKKKKHLATAEDKNPNLKFINNSIFASIEQSITINDFVQKYKISNWKNDREYVGLIWDAIQKSDIYLNYLKTRDSTFKEDKNFIVDIFKTVIAPNEKLYDYYESLNLSWVDDFPLVNTMIVKSIKHLGKGDELSLKGLNIKADDEQFLIDLFRKTIEHHSEYNEEIDNKTPNWDTDRIADIDMILIKMAMTEFLFFPSIPTKVTINEYIEIAKDYSTHKSSYFINGVLDKILKDLKNSNRLVKIGRGLL